MILELPSEIVEYIILQLPYEDILNTGKCCKLLNEITNCQSLWEKCATRDFKVNLKCTKSQRCSAIKMVEDTERNISARIFYKRILLPYGKALNKIWQRTNYDFYGGLLKLLYHNYMLHLVELDPPPYPSIYESLQPRSIATVFVSSSDSNKAIVNYLEYKTIIGMDEIKTSPEYFPKINNGETMKEPSTMTLVSNQYPLPEFIKLHNEWYHNEGDDGKEVEMSKRFGIPRDMARIRFKHKMSHILEGDQQFSAVTTCIEVVSPIEYPIRPGLFKATYGSHGNEIIQLNYLIPTKEIICLKITGDPNVPFGKISFKAFLNQPITREMMECDEEDTGYFENLRNSFDRASSEKTYDNKDTTKCTFHPSSQPFELPKSFFLNDELHSEILKEYKWRFAAKIQIAMAGFRNPRFVDAHMIIFSENTIAVINIDLKSLKICHRVDQRLEKIVNYGDLF